MVKFLITITSVNFDDVGKISKVVVVFSSILLEHVSVAAY